MKTNMFFTFHRWRTFLPVPLLIFMLSACWDSDTLFFAEEAFIDPFGNSRSYAIGEPGKEEVIASKTGHTFSLESGELKAEGQEIYGFVPLDYSVMGRDLSFFIAIAFKNKPTVTKYQYNVFAVDQHRNLYACNLASSSEVQSKQVLLSKITLALNVARDDIETKCKRSAKIRDITQFQLASEKDALRTRAAKKVADGTKKTTNFNLDIDSASRELDRNSRLNQPSAPAPIESVTSTSLQNINLAPTKDENAIFYECAGSNLSYKNSIPEKFCQCLNDQALSKMTDQDWGRYSKDYSEFKRLENEMDRSTPYKESLAFIRSDCMICQEKNFEGCLRGDQKNTSMENMTDLVSNIEFGKFGLVTKDIAYKTLFTHTIRAYSHSCEAYVPYPRTRRTYFEDSVSVGYRILEDSIIASFERYTSDVTSAMASNAAADMYESINNGELPLGGFSVALNAVQISKKLDQILGSNCQKNSRLSKVYTNIVRYELGSPAIVPNGKIAHKSSKHTIDWDRVQSAADKYTQRKMALTPDMPLECKYDYSDIASPPAIQAKIDKEYLLDFVGTHKTFIADLNGVEVQIALWRDKATGSLIKDKRFINGSAYFPSFQCVLPAELKIFRSNYIQLRIDSGGVSTCHEKISGSRLIENGILILKENTKDVSWKMFTTNFLERKLENCDKAVMPLRASKLSDDTIAAMREANQEDWKDYPDDPMYKKDSFWHMLAN